MTRLSRIVGTSLALVSVAALGASAQQPEAPQFVQGASVADRVLEVMIPMRDGVRLATSVFLPLGEGPWPAVLTRTPYGKDNNVVGDPLVEAVKYIEAGYVRLDQDSRGKGRSEGVYRPFADDVEDGFDTIEWIAQQPWSNGLVGMDGASAMAIATYNAAMGAPPHLAAAFVRVGRGTNGAGGGVPMEHISAWSRMQGVAASTAPRPTFRNYDESGGSRDLRSAARNVRIPIHHVAGWYDVFLQGELDSYQLLQENGGVGARGRQRLTIGAFGHGELEGDLRFPSEAGTLLMGDPIRWFDYSLKGIDNGVADEPTVRYFVMGDTFDPDAPGNVWKTSSSWPPPATSTAYYLGPNGTLSRERPSGSASASYVYDPRDPVPTLGGNNLMIPVGPMDQRPVSGRADVLTFVSEPLERAVEVAGPLRAELAVSTDAADTDFMVKLVDVYPSGYEALVQDGAFRLRYVDGFDRQTHIEPGRVYTIEVDLWSTALVFNAGHRIAVHVTSSNWPRFERHTNTWEPLPSYDESVKATNTVWLDGRSSMILPVAVD